MRLVAVGREIHGRQPDLIDPEGRQQALGVCLFIPALPHPLGAIQAHPLGLGRLQVPAIGLGDGQPALGVADLHPKLDKGLGAGANRG